ncbi:outer membrane assembly lipoprotein YfiO [Desulfurobacterium thermolithotrophum DSM 11699]|uniref:Outer membrane assembly lipoprotein YfiO n=1 Tax=Desulfurobacterium thermolithotrophum (strain DSM 11699 / BSA) TaxID=868864 RepID=F0S0L1_DESTD|nr:outer membrane protein assembly factor BamD [Desulfurobacterium thermolithotrophum]ADY72739.1 outer membrane assembly lipoprotein YfiO [Desulfurobacterium thermolithotrophum DSM 11699]
MRKGIIFFVCLLFLFSCEKIPRTAEGLYQEGMKAAKEGDWGKSTEMLEKALEGELPPSKQELAKITLANSYFNDQDFENAALNYEEFLDLYPASPRAKDALFRLGISYLNLVKGPQWDQTFTKKAIRAFEKFVKEFPNDPRVEKAKIYKNIARKILAENEVYIGGTYDMLHKFTASINRYKIVKEKYRDVESLDRIDYLIGRAYFFTDIQAKEEIDRLKRQLDKEKEKLNSSDPEAKKVAENRIRLVEKDIEKWQKIAKKNKEIGKRILTEVAAKYPNSTYGIKAKRILEGEKILNVEPVINPLKRSIWWKIKETL